MQTVKQLYNKEQDKTSQACNNLDWNREPHDDGD